MNKTILFLFLAIICINIAVFSAQRVEGFTLNQASGTIKESNSLLVQDSYPPISRGTISNNDANRIWRNYPIFELGSYAQVTNNIRFPDNPDEGTCMPASMCGAMYHKKTYLPECNAPPSNDKTRVGFFSTDETIITSLPYRSKTNNILY